MADTPEHLAERLTHEGHKTIEFFRALTPQQLNAELYSEGGIWAARQVLAHFVATEIGILQLIDDILAGGSGASEDFDIDRFNKISVSKLKDAAVGELLLQFEQRRAASAARVASMTVDDLQKIGRHPFLGPTTVDEIIKMLYLHNQIHQRDIRRLVNASTAD
jgi:hypothetical protein